VEHYARIVHERWLKRRLLAATSDIQTDCYEHASDIYELIDRAERRVFEIAEYSTRERGLFSMKRLAGETRQMLETARRDQALSAGMIGVPSGFRTLDNLTGGFQGSDLIVVAARPAMGKSSLALSIARNAAVESRVPVAFFTLEMSPQQMMLRLVSAEAEVDALSLRTGRASDADWKRIGGAIERMQGVPLFIEDAPGLGIMELRARARMLKREHGVGLIIVDYLQLMHAPRAERREREISMISRSLKQLAKELHVPVIALSQLNRALESRVEKRPMLSDLRESGAIEEDSDMVLFIHRPEYYGEKYYENGTTTAGVAEVIVAKHRNGPTGVAKLSFRKEFARFGPLRDAEEIEEYRRSVSNGMTFR
jgi:replicative DNA helicase